MKMRKGMLGVAAAFATAALALAIAPTAALATPIDVLGTGSLKVTGLNPGDQVEVYRVAQTQVDDTTNVLSSSWIVTPTDDLPVLSGSDVTLSQDQANLVASRLGNISASGCDTADGTEGSAVAEIDNLTAGLYYVKVTNDSNATRVYQNTVLPVYPKDSNADGAFTDADVWDVVEHAIKATNTGIDKTVADGDVEDAAYAETINTLGYGDTADFKITVTVPTYTQNATDRTFTVTDTLVDDYLDLESLKAADVTVTAANVADWAANVDYAVAYDAQTGVLTVNITDSGLHKLNNAGVTSVEIAYSVKVDAQKVGTDVDLNGAKLVFSKNSYDTTTGSDTDKVTASFYGLKITKVDADDQNKTLAGAEFKITNATTGQVIGTFTTNSNGVIELVAALGDKDTYKIEETKAPAGYQIGTFEDYTVDADKASDGVISVTLTDEADDFQLPQTGGPGTIALTVVGAGLVAGAACLVARSRKES